jgi:phosphoglycerate dehydrogenase-like enzyme
MDMAIKIGINGFGRIGRLVFRAAMKIDPQVRDSRNKRPVYRPGLHEVHAEI